MPPHPRHPHLLRLLLTALALTGANAEELPTAPPVSASPTWQRCELAAGATSEVELLLCAARDCSLIAVDTDCGCIAVTTGLPLAIAAGQPAAIRLRVVGVRSGVKTVTLRSTAGAATATIQVVTSGIGQGDDLLRTMLNLAAARRQRAWFVLHDLKGALRNCGCSSGALGGVEHLAALPAACAAIAPSVACEFVLSGDVDGPHAGLEAALAARGWRRDERVIASADPAAALREPDVVAVVVTAPAPINNRRLLRPLLDRGMVIHVLLVDRDGSIAESHDLPIDATLARDDGILAGFPQRLTMAIAEDARSQRCASCHPGAHAVWAASPHARAWQALAAADRVDGCVGCHTTRADGGVDADQERPQGPRHAQVHCQACHIGADAHADAPTVRTTATVDCRACHDARHDPSFHADLWEAVRHGRE
ncbi:MAG TPA: multiheme c-type cytochrome [Planctomycetota bacterium]|nr:multiheme c-type cytochrome [Planctomycetota bacterium]